MYVDLIQRKVICPFIDNPGLKLVQGVLQFYHIRSVCQLENENVKKAFQKNYLAENRS